MNYRFDYFKELATGDGFNYPVDVYDNTIYLGTLVAKPNGFVIKQVDTPDGKQSVAQSSKNIFKNANMAADVLHRTWKTFRHGGDESGELVPA